MIIGLTYDFGHMLLKSNTRIGEMISPAHILTLFEPHSSRTPTASNFNITPIKTSIISQKLVKF